MIITPPAARVPIVAPPTGMMASHFQRVVQALCDGQNGLFAGAVSGSALTLDSIPASATFLRINFDLTFSSDGAALYLTGRTGSGTDVTSNSWSKPYNNDAATFISVSDTSDPQVIIAQSVQSDADVGGVHGEIVISNIQGTGYKRVGGWVTHYDGTRERANLIAGRIDTAAALTGVKLAPSAGTVSGVARVEAA